LLIRGRTHQSFLAEQRPQDGGFVVDQSTARQKKPRSVGEGPGEEVESVELLVDELTCWRFSGPHRNYHTDRDEARKLGFPEIVVQGMLSTCLISQAMANAFGEGWFAGGRMDVKLINVTWAGERLLARGKFREELSEGSARRRVLEVWAEKADPQRTPVVVGTASALI
ncbi:MAG: MaoC/PaaZ C-terminal domain-containing protein, partial [Planctomycetota bacterium]